MIRNIFVPKLAVATTHIVVGQIHVRSGQQVRVDAPLITLYCDNQHITIPAKYNGWITHIAVNTEQNMQVGDLLLVLDAITTYDYSVDSNEVNPQTELGSDARRGLERDGQRKFGQGYSNELITAPAARSEMGHAAQQNMQQHPFLSHMKESATQRMSAKATENHDAVDKLVEDASKNPELTMQLNNQLKQQLNIQSKPTPSPKLTLGSR